MNFLLNATMLDIVFIIFTIFMLLLGYNKGFVVRLYDFLATIVALLLSIFFSGPLSDIIHLYATSGMLMLLASFVNRIFIFGILFSIFRLLFLILGKFVKPIIKGGLSKILFINKFDRILGAVLSLIESLFLAYLVLLLSISPIFVDGKEVVNDTVVAKHVLKLTPSLSNQIMKITDDFQTINGIMEHSLDYDYTSPENISFMVSLLSRMQDLDMLSKEDTDGAINMYIQTLEKTDTQIVIDYQTYETLQDMLANMDTTNINTEKLFEKIIVSE